MELADPFGFIVLEGGGGIVAQLQLIINTPFLNDNRFPSPPPPEPVPEPEPEPGPELASASMEQGAEARNVDKMKKKGKMPVQEPERSPPGGSPKKGSGPIPKPARRTTMDLFEALKLLSPEPDKSLENVDILEIAAMKGIHFEPPRWHRPGGYDRKPRNSQ